jgi:hypothetical protein
MDGRQHYSEAIRGIMAAEGAASFVARRGVSAGAGSVGLDRGSQCSDLRPMVLVDFVLQMLVGCHSFLIT